MTDFGTIDTLDCDRHLLEFNVSIRMSRDRQLLDSTRHMANAFFSDLLATISERGRTLLRRGDPSDNGHDASNLIELCEALLSGRGEATGTAMARDVLDRYHD